MIMIFIVRLFLPLKTTEDIGRTLTYILTGQNESFWISANFVFIRSLNCQWEIDDYAEPYYHPGKDVNSFSSYINFSYFF